MLAHQHFRPPGFPGRDRFIDTMMIIMAAANIAVLEGNDVAARRYRHVVANPNHLGKHAIARRGQQSIVKVAVDVAINREVARLERAALQKLVPGGQAALDYRTRVRTQSAFRRKPRRDAFERGADFVSIDNSVEWKLTHREAAVGGVIQKALSCKRL